MKSNGLSQSTAELWPNLLDSMSESIDAMLTA